MGVGVDESRNDGAATEVEMPGARARERQHVGVPPDGENAVACDRDRFGHGRSLIERQHAPAMEDEIGDRRGHGAIIARRFSAVDGSGTLCASVEVDNLPTGERGERAMPLYEYLCEKCKREVTIPMTISQHDKGGAACPECGSTALRPQVGTVFTQTSRKS
jgi:putative FmdB family regulatory protein